MSQRAATLSRADLATSTIAVAAAALLTAAAAQVNVPYTPVPQTLQTLVVLAAGCALGAQRGAASQLLYLAMGSAGMPVFAEWKAGVAVLSGPTGGYLFGFVVAAFVAGWICDRAGREFWVTLPAMLVASVPIYVLGLAWLRQEIGVGWAAAADVGLEPFVIADLLKIFAAAALLDPRAPWGPLTRRLL